MSLYRSCLVFGLTLIVAGCGGPANDTTTSGKSTAAKPDAAAGSSTGSKKGPPPVPAQADDVLSSAIHQLRPQNYGINSSPEKPVSLLNSWRTKHAERSGIVEQPIPVNAPQGWIESDSETRLAQVKFDMPDCVHIRDAMMFHVIAGYLGDRATDELQRVKTVVDFACRNVVFWNDNELSIPLIPYLCIQLGRGSAEDRAWICAEILRQLRIDCVVLRAKSDTKETTDKWLLGVILDQKVYLFDLVLGLPVSNGVDDKIAASLDQIVASPELLEKMAATGTYRLSVGSSRVDLQACKLEYSIVSPK